MTRKRTVNQQLLFILRGLVIGGTLRLNINSIIDRIEEICGILKYQVASEDKEKLNEELEKLLLDVAQHRRSVKKI